MDGVPDIAEGENGLIEECDSEDDLIPIWIGGNYCGAAHLWGIGVAYVWHTYDNDESCTYAAFAGRIWYRLEGNGEYDPLWANAVPPRWNLGDVKTRRINGVLYRALPAYPAALPYTECHSTDPDAPHTSGPPFPFAITGDPRDWVGRLFLEPYRDPSIPEDAVARLYVNVGSIDPAGVSWYGGFVSCYFQSLETLDLRGWGASTDPSGNPALLHEDLESNGIANPLGWKVGGAITDGTSICMIRHNPTEVLPPSVSLDSLVRPMQVRMTKRVDSTDTPGYLASWAGAAGTMHPADPMSLPMLPTPSQTIVQPPIQLEDGRAFYVPPDSYLDPQHTGYSEEDSHNSDEVCLMSIRGTLPNGQTLSGGRSFVLRRPPIVLVHGIYSGPETWDTSIWVNEGNPGPTKLYKVDYSATSMKGFSENYPKLVETIDQAMYQYRNGNIFPQGESQRPIDKIRFAATRADVVGHSQGGQLARWYIANTTLNRPQSIDRPGWREDIDNFRASSDPNYRWPYLRPSNWGAGSIRRLITLNSPFKGSPMADEAHSTMMPGDPALQIDPIQAFEQVGAIAGTLGDETASNILDSAFGGDEHTCVPDLIVGSVASQILEGSPYPGTNRMPLWHPIGTFLGPGAPSSAVRWSRLNLLERLWVTNFTAMESLLTASNSDWVVGLYSQKNLPVGSTVSPSSRGSEFVGLSHTNVLDNNGARQATGVTGSSEARNQVSFLISITSDTSSFSPFSSQWNIGP
jgi:hypothetical protein